MKFIGHKYFRLVDQLGNIQSKGGVTVGVWSEGKYDSKHIYVFAVCSPKDQFSRHEGHLTVMTHAAASCGISDDDWISSEDLKMENSNIVRNRAGQMRQSWRDHRKIIWMPEMLEKGELTHYVHNAFRMANPKNGQLLEYFALLVPCKKKKSTDWNSPDGEVMHKVLAEAMGANK